MAEGKRIKDIDLMVGQNMRNIRVHLGLTQQQLAARLGVTYQQTHKYEKGHNRMSAAMLAKVTEALECSLETLFAGVLDNIRTPDVRERRMLSLANDLETLPPEEFEHLRAYIVNMAKMWRQRGMMAK